MLTGKELGDAISEAIRLKKESGAISGTRDVAAHFGIKTPSIYDWMKKGSIGKEKLQKLFDYFSDVVGPDHWGISNNNWLLESRTINETGTIDTLHADGRDVYPIGKGRPIPVIGNGNGGHLPERVWDDQGYPVGYSDEYSEIATSDQHAFIVRVRGDSMWPKYTPGEYALVEPDTTPDVGDDILVRLATGETLIKTLAARSPDGVRLSSYNNTEVRFYANHEITWMYWVPFPIPAKKIKTRS